MIETVLINITLVCEVGGSKGYNYIKSYVSQVYEPTKSSGKSISIQYMSTRWMGDGKYYRWVSLSHE